MNKLTVFIENNASWEQSSLSKEIILDRNIKINQLFVKNASVFSDFKNIKDKYKNIKVGSKDIVLDEGYYTFENICEKLAPEGLCFSTTQDHHVNIFHETEALSLYHFGTLLGFSLNKKIAANTWTKSESPADINLGLRYITVHCDIVDCSKNFDTHGKLSSAIVTLPITTGQKLSGSVTQYKDIESSLEVREGIYNKLNFWTSSNKAEGREAFNKNVGSVLMEISLS